MSLDVAGCMRNDLRCMLVVPYYRFAKEIYAKVLYVLRCLWDVCFDFVTEKMTSVYKLDKYNNAFSHIPWISCISTVYVGAVGQRLIGQQHSATRINPTLALKFL